tara:strand:+ start:11379 stop:11804 length:426 start_codon:yes stop_codon:yes gene_type:complete
METIKNQTRRDAREGAMQALFAYQYTKDSSTEFLSKFLKSFPKNKINSHFISDLYLCVIKNSEWADNLIKKHLQNWELNRVALVDQVLLKMGACEIYFMDDIPPKVTISEMVEIAKVYSTDESSSFVNGILDSIFKDYSRR